MRKTLRSIYQITITRIARSVYYNRQIRMLETVSGMGLHECLANFISRYSFFIVHGNQSPARSEKHSSVITDLAYVLILLIKEKDRSASALDISNVQPTTSRKLIIHVTCTQSFKKSFRNFTFLFGIPTYLYVHTFRVLEVFLPFKHIIDVFIRRV